MGELKDVLSLIDSLSPEEKRHVLAHVRQSVQLHPMESRLMASAEMVLEAISRSSPMTVRGIERIIAEASFVMEVLPDLKEWREVPLEGGNPFDFQLSDESEYPDVRLQVKMQRRKEHRPLMANEIYKAKRGWPSDFYVVEIQRTRRGEDKAGTATRPYRFHEFDVLAVSLGAAHGRWRDFVYTVADWLLPDPDNPTLILKYQPVSPIGNEDWTTDFRQAVEWLRSTPHKTIRG